MLLAQWHGFGVPNLVAPEPRPPVRGKIRQLVRGIELSHLHNGGFAIYIDFIESYVRSIFVMPDGTFNMLDDRCPVLFSGGLPK